MKMILKTNAIRYGNPFHCYADCSNNRTLKSSEYSSLRRREYSSRFINGMKCSNDKWTMALIAIQETIAPAFNQRLTEGSTLRGIFI